MPIPSALNEPEANFSIIKIYLPSSVILDIIGLYPSLSSVNFLPSTIVFILN